MADGALIFGKLPTGTHDIPRILRRQTVTTIKVGGLSALRVAFHRQNMFFVNGVAQFVAENRRLQISVS